MACFPADNRYSKATINQEVIMFCGGDNVGATSARDIVCRNDDTVVHGDGDMSCEEKFDELAAQGDTCDAVLTFFDSYTPEDQAALSPEFKMLNAGCSILKFFTE